MRPVQDWFERITGFPETTFAETQARLCVEGDHLVHASDGTRHRIGTLQLPRLADLREHGGTVDASGRRSTVRCVVGDARELHSRPEFSGALFQVASQFNLLEMVGPDVTPEHGVTRYRYDRTQGPACAMAAGAATIYRNYLIPLGDQLGQTAHRQIDALADLGEALAARVDRPHLTLWAMRNGYALPTAQALASIGRVLAAASESERDALRARLRIGLHEDTQVTDLPADEGVLVSQAFCSALPVAYSRIPAPAWEPFARLVLEAAYEATVLAAAARARAGQSHTVLLTRLGGGAFGNDEAWIDDAIDRALGLVEFAGLDICLVSFGSVHPSFRAAEKRWAG